MQRLTSCAMVRSINIAFSSPAAVSTLLKTACNPSHASLSTCASQRTLALPLPRRGGASIAPHLVRMVSTEQAVQTKESGGRRKKKKGRDGAPRARREKKSSQSKALLAALERFEPVVGVEVHVQLATRTKAYCACSTKTVRTPNTNVCPVCMGHPGALPVLNRETVKLAAQAAIALNCTVATESRFDRKNYYYADTAKNYQITQQHHPIAEHGYLALVTSGKRIGITRLHMEEDSAKMSHEGAGASGRLTDSTHSLIDFNRAGIPLIEIVSEPDMRSGVEAAEYGQELQRVLRHIRASDCNMQDGSLRCDVNISIRPIGEEKLGTKVELKNLNSFSAVQKAIDFEIERQAGMIDSNERIVQETRTWDEKENKTKSMRVKEGAADYRYFPEPDLPPVYLDAKKLEEWKESLPELPAEKRARFETELNLSSYDAFLLADDFDVSCYFEEAIAAGCDPKLCANWIMGDMTKILNSEKMRMRDCKLTPANLTQLIGLIQDGTTSGKVAKDLLFELVTQGGNPGKIIKHRKLVSIKDAVAMSELIVGVMDAHPEEVEAYRNGKTKLFGFFVGKLMAASNGLADPQLANDLLRLNLEP